MQETRIVIVNYCGARITALIKDDRVFDILAVSQDEGRDLKPGDIVKGKVENIQKNLDAAFILLSNGVRGFMDIKGDPSQYRPGDELIVQVVKEPFGEKEMVVSPDYSVAGRYLVLTGNRHGVGVSRKIEDVRKDELKKLVHKMLSTYSDIGAVVRTNAENASDREIEEEFDKLISIMREISKKAEHSVPFIRLYNAPSPESSFIRDLREEPSEIITDDPAIYERLKEELIHDEGNVNRIRLYKDEYPLIKLTRLEAVIDEAFKKTVYLKSGGNIVIEKTEACHVIDVNSGKNTRKISKDELVKETNLEAVREACRQMRIRNLSGMILMDLINMTNRDLRDTVINELKSELKKDRLKADFIDITGLGIAEITREKERVTLREVING